MLAAEASQASGDWAGATQYWRSLLQRDPGNERYAIGLVDGLRHTGHYGEAVQVMTEVLQLRPPTAGLLTALGKAQLAAGRREEAIASLNEAALLAPDDWRAQSALAVAYGMSGQSEVADQHYRQALSLVPDDPVVLNNYALHLAISGRLDAGLDVMKQAAGVVGAPSQVRQNLALLLAIKGDMAAAEEIVRSELSRDAADRQMAFLRTLSSDDLIDLGGIVQQSTLDIDSTALPPPETAMSVADLTNLGASGSAFLEDQPGVVVVEEEAVVVPPAAPPAEPAGQAALEGDLLAIETEQETLPGAPPPEADLEEAAGTVTASEPEAAATEAAEVAAPEATPAQSLAAQSAAVSAALTEALGSESLVIAPPQAADGNESGDTAPPGTVPAPAVQAPAPPPEDGTIAMAIEEVPAAAAAAGPWRVQLASLATRDAAERGRSQALAAHGGLLDPVGVAVVEARLDNGTTTWRVLAGGFADKSGAAALCERIKSEGGDCFVMKDAGGG